MLTHNLIRKETEELEKVFNAGGLDIPSMTKCLVPGLLVFTLHLICPFAAFFLLSWSGGDDFVVAMGFSAFTGLLMLFIITNAMTLYYSAPKSFRLKSEVFALLRRKARSYGVAYVTIQIIIVYISAMSGLGAFAYLLPMILNIVILGFCLGTDLGRYKLSVFSSVIESFGRKLKGEKT